MNTPAPSPSSTVAGPAQMKGNIRTPTLLGVSLLDSRVQPLDDSLHQLVKTRALFLSERAVLRVAILEKGIHNLLPFSQLRVAL
jgi:hypothetical protein